MASFHRDSILSSILSLAHNTIHPRAPTRSSTRPHHDISHTVQTKNMSVAAEDLCPVIESSAFYGGADGGVGIAAENLVVAGASAGKLLSSQ